MQRKTRENARGKGKKKKREVMRVLHLPRPHRRHHKGGPQWGAEAERARVHPPSDTLLRTPHPDSVAFRESTWQTEMLTLEGGDLTLWEMTPIHKGVVLSTPQSLFTPCFARRYLWDMDCQRFRKDPVCRSRTAKGWDHIWNPASDLRLPSGSSNQAKTELAGNTSIVFYH